MLRAGDLRHRYEYQEKLPTTEGRDEHGHQVENWTTLAILYGAEKQLSGTEAVTAAQLYGTATHQVQTRYHHELTPTTAGRLKRNERCLYIASINNVDSLDKEWLFVCGEKLDG